MHSIKEYAALLGISRQAVLKKIGKGQVKAEKVGAYWVVTQEPDTKPYKEKQP